MKFKVNYKVQDQTGFEDAREELADINRVNEIVKLPGLVECNISQVPVKVWPGPGVVCVVWILTKVKTLRMTTETENHFITGGCINIIDVGEQTIYSEKWVTWEDYQKGVRP